MRATNPIVVLVTVLLIVESMAVAAQSVASRKISQPIEALLSAAEAQSMTRRSASAMVSSGPSSPLVRVDSRSRVQLYVHLHRFDDAAIDVLREHELEIEVAIDDLAIVQGWAPLDRCREIAELSFVKRITQPNYATRHEGDAETLGGKILKAEPLRRLGLDGSGVKVGVISDGANMRAQAQASGDLPSEIATYGKCRTRPAESRSCRREWTCNEGTAMLEIIHDIAPAAQLAIGAASTTLEFVESARKLVNKFGADIVVDDLSFLGEPYFADGFVAKAIARLAQKTIYVTAAGNATGRHYESVYRSTLFQGVDDVHDFGSAAGGSKDTGMDVSIEAGEYLVIFLQWDDRYGSSRNDYDLYLLKKGQTELLCPSCASNFTQSGSSNPIEAICYYNGSSDRVRGRVLVNRASGERRRIEMFLLGRRAVEEYDTPKGAICGHAGLPSVLTVGAIDASDPGNDDIEPYSSRGPARISFPSVRLRRKPDVTGIDGVAVTGAGGFPSLFYGTSAAAPHVAGIAALLRQRVPEATVAEIRTALKAGAVDLGAPGFDDTFGAGRVDAARAVMRLHRDVDSDGVDNAAERTAGRNPLVNEVVPLMSVIMESLH
jgi:hypothetical protein